MVRRTRFFLFGSMAVLLIGLCTGLIAYYGGLPMGALARTGIPAELEYVPADAALVAYANVHDVMRSDLRQRLRHVTAGKEEGQAEFERQTGINIERDIDHVVAFVTRGPDEEQHQGMVLASGRFDTARLEGLALQHGGETETYKGMKLVTRPRDSGDAKDLTLAFLGPATIAVGDTGSVKSAIDRFGADNVTNNQELMDRIRAVEGSNAWAVGRFDALMDQAKLPPQMAGQMPAIRWFSASGQVNGGIRGLVRAEARDEEAGRNLREVVQGFLALAKMQAGGKPEIQTIVNSLELTGEGNSVSLRFTVPAEVIDTFSTPPQPQTP